MAGTLDQESAATQNNCGMYTLNSMYETTCSVWATTVSGLAADIAVPFRMD